MVNCVALNMITVYELMSSSSTHLQICEGSPISFHTSISSLLEIHTYSADTPLSAAHTSYKVIHHPPTEIHISATARCSPITKKLHFILFHRGYSIILNMTTAEEPMASNITHLQICEGSPVCIHTSTQATLSI